MAFIAIIGVVPTWKGSPQSMLQRSQYKRLCPVGPLVIVLGLMPTLVMAQSHSCAAINEPNARLACYDKTFPPNPGAGSAVLDIEAERERAVEDYGLNRQQLVDRRPAELREIVPDRIEGVVKSVTERATGERVVALENGQTWLLTEVTSRGRLRVGDKVTIRDAALGTHMLLTPTRVPLRARRLN